ncbi:(2Fe-2S)-binding protein [Knoellia locipacati]|uniref:(2Fe-2S)-binding protein n=1 Tax=Knoellia locipacati TaxID=882824 RepID=UPI00385178F6
MSAFAACTGPWRVVLGTLEASGLSCDLAPGLYPERIGFLAVEPADHEPAARVEEARTAYLRLGREIANAYDVDVKMSTRQRLGMVEDLWEMALREARAATGGGWGPTVERRSCCLIYALPGCHECAGCPRLTTST